MENKGARVAKVIAAAGVCSRRDAERLIEQKRVRVNGNTLSTPATIVPVRARATTKLSRST